MANIKVRLKKTDGEWLELGKRYISDLSSLSQSTSDPSSIQYGVLANSGSITINDIDGRLAQCVENGEIVSSGLEIEIYSKDTLIQKHILQDADYDKHEKTLTLQLTDEMEKMSKVSLTPISTDENGMTLDEMFYRVLGRAGVSYSDIDRLYYKKIYNNETGNETLLERLRRVSLPYFYNKQSTLGDFLSKVCETCKLNFHQIDGEYVFTTGRPEKFLPSTIVIPRKCLISPPTEQMFLKNSIGKVTYTDYNFRSEIKDIANATFYTRDDDDNFTIANVPSGEIKTIESRERLCCFLDISTNDEYFVPILSGDGSSSQSPYPFWYGQFNNNNSSQERYLTAISTNTTSTKDTFAFSAGASCTHLATLKGLNTATFALNNSLPQNYSTITARIEAKIYAKCVSTAPTQVSVGEGAEYTVPDNEYLTQDAIWLSSYISDTLSDWENGVNTTSLDIFCTNLYYEDGTLAKNWDNGEVLKVGDTVKLPNDDTLWKVTSREFKWSGSPRIALQLQGIPLSKVLWTADSNASVSVLNNLGEIVKNGGAVYRNSTLQISVAPRTGYEVTSVYVNGETATKDGEAWVFTATSNSVITRTYQWISELETNLSVEVGSQVYNPDNYEVVYNSTTRYAVWLALYEGSSYVGEYMFSSVDDNAQSFSAVNSDGETILTGTITDTTLNVTSMTGDLSARIYYNVVKTRTV